MDTSTERTWSPPVIDVSAGGSRIVFFLLALFAGLTGALAVACLASDELRGPGLVIAGIPAAIVGAIAYWYAARARARRLTVHVEGVRLVEGGATTQLRFDEIEAINVRCWQVAASHVGGLGAVGAIAQGAVNATVRAADRRNTAADLPYDSTQVTVKLQGAGRTIVLRKWDKRWADAYAEIRARVEPRLLVTARAQLANGGAAFGPVRVGTDAVAVGDKKLVPFTDLERIDVDRFTVMFRARGKRLPAAKVQLARVPNVHVMLDLVGERARPAA